MLVIGRKRDEKLIIGGNIEITVLKVGRNHVKFGVEAPKDIPIETRLRKPDAVRAAGAGADITQAPEPEPSSPDPAVDDSTPS